MLRLSSWYLAYKWFIVPMLDDERNGAFDWVRIGRGNHSNLRKGIPIPLCPQQIPHELTWYCTWVTVVRSQ
jgi:hypothetical protein